MSLNKNATYKSMIKQYAISIIVVVAVSFVSQIIDQYFGYRVVALILLVTVSLLAMIYDIKPALLAAILSALIWNYFYIPPVFTLSIKSAEDLLMFLMYFIVALVNAVLTFKIRKAEKQIRTKDEKDRTIKLFNTILNSLSHELRTPIATILGAVDTLKDQHFDLREENKVELLQQIESSSLRLNRQVQNLLNISRIESGNFKLNLVWTDINDVVVSAIEKLDDIKMKQRIEFVQLEELPLFKLDDVLIHEVVYNLLHNAVIYSPASKRVFVKVEYNMDCCIILIEDEGPGFPEELMEFVFDKFYRLPNSGTGGVGLGLSIVKGYVEAHNGIIKLENRIDGGAAFRITIPTEISTLKFLKNE